MIAKKCVTRHHVYHYSHFADSQWRLLEKQNPPTVKALLYVYRVLLTGILLMRTGEIEANLVNLNKEFRLSHVDELILRKGSSKEKGSLENGEIDYHRGEFETLKNALQTASEKRSLPEAPGARAELDDLLVGIRKHAIGQ